MENNKNGKGLMEDIPAAIAAGAYGVPKSLIAGYFITKFLRKKDDERQRKGDERQRKELEKTLNEMESRRGRTREFLQALEQYESVYGPRQKTNFIPGSAYASSKKSASKGFNPTNQYKSVSWLLGTGIFFMPYIFSWFTLKSNYSKNTKIISFVWLIFVAGILATGNHKTKIGTTQEHVKADKPIPTQNDERQAFIDKMRSWASDIPTTELQKICEASAGAGVLALRRIETGKAVDPQTFAEEFPSLLPFNISPEYLPKAKIIWEKNVRVVISNKEKYLQMMHDRGDVTLGVDMRRTCKTIFIKPNNNK